MKTGQLHRLTIPVDPPLSDINAAITEFTAKLEALGVPGFFLAFTFTKGPLQFHASTLQQSNALPARELVHIAALEAVQMMDLLYMTDELNQQKQERHYTAPTLKP